VCKLFSVYDPLARCIYSSQLHDVLHMLATLLMLPPFLVDKLKTYLRLNFALSLYPEQLNQELKPVQVLFRSVGQYIRLC